MYESETWSLILRERYKLNIFENKETENDIWVLNIGRKRRMEKTAPYLCPNIIRLLNEGEWDVMGIQGVCG